MADTIIELSLATPQQIAEELASRPNQPFIFAFSNQKVLSNKDEDWELHYAPHQPVMVSLSMLHDFQMALTKAALKKKS